MKRNVFVFLVLLVVWSCSEDEGLDSGPRTLEEANATYQALYDTISGLQTTEGLTREREFPTSGIKTFKGTHIGSFREGVEIEYVADVVFTLNFETQDFTGELSNFTTGMPGFESPEGVLKISGSIRGTEDLGGDEYGLGFSVQHGDLIQGEISASFDAFTTSKGRFYGHLAQFIGISVESVFEWNSGPHAGTTSTTRGTMFALME